MRKLGVSSVVELAVWFQDRGDDQGRRILASGFSGSETEFLYRLAEPEWESIRGGGPGMALFRRRHSRFPVCLCFNITARFMTGLLAAASV